MRCPTCSAHNVDAADWCTQCFASLRPPPSGPPDGTGAAPAAVAAPSAGGAAPADLRDVREREGSVEWRCATCEAWTVLARPDCRSCGAPRRGFGEAAVDARPTASAATVLWLSVLLPGAGHLAAGRIGTGVARALLAVVWVSGGIGLLLAARGADASALPAVPLLLGAAILWGMTLLDAQALSRGGRERLGSRPLLALTGAVIAALFLLLLFALPR